jgi:hypothetical protein
MGSSSLWLIVKMTSIILWAYMDHNLNKMQETNNLPQSQPLQQTDASGSLHYDEKLLIELWYRRNPSHEINADSGEDMFWKTAFMVFEDYVREVLHNDR